MRNVSIELYRIFLMFGICLLHSITQGGNNVVWAANLFDWCVSGFVFLSGWFGIRFSFLKLIKLYCISFYCAACYVLFDVLMTGGLGSVNFVDIGIRCYRIAIGQWFLNAYVVLMCFAPILNLACSQLVISKWDYGQVRKCLQILGPLFVCVFGWSFATTLPIVGKLLPQSVGVTAYSFLMMLGVYTGARWLRLNDHWIRPLILKQKKFVIIGACVCLLAMCLGFEDYNSPFSFSFAAICFYAFNQVQVPQKVGAVCVWLAPSMFSVYLMHSHGYAWDYLKCIESYLVGNRLPLSVVFLCTASAIFGASVLLDMPRRFFIWGIQRFGGDTYGK